MPEISRFLGIVIAMYYRDHAPPHFHAVYGEYEATIAIDSGEVNGVFPKRALAHVQEWRNLHRDELMETWVLARASRALPVLSLWSNTMLPRIVSAKYSGAYTIWLRFADGAEGEVNLANELEGEIFEPLKDQSYFSTFTLHPELRTVVWPNGADFAPEFLRSAVRVEA